ncbi:MAG: LacI family DNA-binding transcriptional regulator, partial [Anaerolineae bacterium]|nr:LacI family DNA-binding transcriptional regulator [Anaerolineae bacterium]
MAATLSDIARAAGVSVSTVSRVLSNPEYPVHDDTRRRILDIARQMHYKPNLLARSLRNERSFSVGVIVDNIVSIFAPPIIRGIQDTLKPEGYTCVIINADWDGNQEVDAIRDLVSRSADGIIFVDTWLHPANVLDDAPAVPCVFVNRLFSSGKSIGPDDRHGASLAVEHLIGLEHVRIGFINGPTGWDASQKRLLGYQDALRKHSLPLDETLVFEGDWDVMSAYRAAQRLLSLPDRPTALFAANDVMALGAIYAVQDAGLRVPDDMAVVGFDDQDFSAFCQPTLTTVTMPVYEMGARAARMVLSAISGGANQVETELVRGRLVIRESCGHPLGRQTVKTSVR